MSIIGIICLSAISAAFVLFAAVLAWGDYQTRHVTRAIKRDEQGGTATGAGFATLEQAAAKASEPIHAA